MGFIENRSACGGVGRCSRFISGQASPCASIRWSSASPDRYSSSRAKSNTPLIPAYGTHPMAAPQVPPKPLSSVLSKRYGISMPDNQITVAYPPDHAGDNFELFVRRGDANPLCVCRCIHRQYRRRHRSRSLVADLDHRSAFPPAHGKTGLLLTESARRGCFVLCLSGIVIWWAGIRNWARGLKVNLHSGWKRINYDLHSASSLLDTRHRIYVGFYGCLFLYGLGPSSRPSTLFLQ